MPGADTDLFYLRPLTGAQDQLTGVHKRLHDLVRYTHVAEGIEPADFPPPTPEDLADAGASHLLWQAARLTLREGAAPLRSLGRISIRPRIYQFVPLLMALRLDPVRLLIADDVGVGKTIEALLVARELLDRGEIRRLCVLCPPYLCEQWQKELAEKVNLDAVIIRSGTVGQLERGAPQGRSVYQHYPVQVASIDFVKSDRNRHLFLKDCPEFVIVDEAHGAAAASARQTSQQQRHELLREVARQPDRHLVLVTATPHSGIEAAFRSLLGLLDPRFAAVDTGDLSESQRSDLARHFVQRTRADIRDQWEHAGLFPKRIASDETYSLSKPYMALFRETYDFCRELVETGGKFNRRQQRVRYWAALGLLRSVMSSPRAAAAFNARLNGLPATDDDAEETYKRYVLESTGERPDDSAPTPPVEAAATDMTDNDRRRLRQFAQKAAALEQTGNDSKLIQCATVVGRLLRAGFHPIVWCRYIATAQYVADGLPSLLSGDFRNLRCAAVTGLIGDDERRAKVSELAQHTRRVLVATDCLSEGINLQQDFNAVIHYDLPWNPNRLEQREGRVDRYGQTAPEVKAVRLYSPDNPVDGVVIDILLRKADEIHRALGTHVPVPEDSETVTEALLNALFLRGAPADADSGQLTLDLGVDLPEVRALHRRWDEVADRERTNRTRFAQRALKPEEVACEVEAADKVLGDPDAVREFVLAATKRLNWQITAGSIDKTYRLATDAATLSRMPDAVKWALPRQTDSQWLISFESPKASYGCPGGRLRGVFGRSP